MAVRDRSIGSTGLEQGGPNLGNDYSRDITREKTEDDTLKVVIPKDKKDAEEKDKNERESERRNDENR